MIVRLFALLTAVTIFAGCKKEYNLDLSADNKNFLVVEGQITDQNEIQFVKLTRTLSFLDNGEPATVDNAEIYVQFDDKTVHYTHINEGLYVAPANFIGQVGTTYNLTILVDDKKYTASSTMYPPHYISNLFTRKSKFADDHYDVICDLNTYSDEEEYMMFRCEIDSVHYNAIEDISFASNGSFGQGTFKEVQLYYTEYKNQKKITVHTYTIDKPFYTFLRAASDAISMPSPLGTPPGASIPGNISGDALGFFFAASVTKESADIVME